MAAWLVRNSRAVALGVLIVGNVLSIGTVAFVGVMRGTQDDAKLAFLQLLWTMAIPSAIFAFAHLKLSTWQRQSAPAAATVPVISSLVILAVAVFGALIVMIGMLSFGSEPVSIGIADISAKKPCSIFNAVDYAGTFFGPVLMFALMLDAFSVPQSGNP